MEIGITERLVFLAFAAGCAGFAYVTLTKRWRWARLGQPFDPHTEPGERRRSVWVNVILQKKLMKNPLRGFFHILVFFGFLVYVLHTGSQFLGALLGDYFFYLPSFAGLAVHGIYDTLLDLFTVLVLAGLLFFLLRRYLFRAPELDRPSLPSLIVIGMISALMVFTLMESPSRTLLQGGHTGSLLRPLFMSAFEEMSREEWRSFFLLGWWGHVIVILLFMLYVPVSKHAHLFWAPVNFWFFSKEPRGKMPDLDVENASYWGAASAHEFSWKNHLDTLSCIECGRCQLACPASRTGKALSPKTIMMSMKKGFLEKMPAIEKTLGEEGGGAKISEEGQARYLDEYITRDEIWACTSCYACAETCPVGNNPMEPVLQMRRSAVLNEGAMPAQLQGALTNMENQSNPWGISSDEREKWTEGLSVKTMRQWKEEGGSPEYLYWVGCAGAFDDRNKKIAQTLVELLNQAGVTFGILGIEENCTGDSARRAGNEYLYQTLAQTNIELLNGYGVTKIVTACPHCLNTLQNEYPVFGGQYEVTHHSQLIADLIREGKLKVEGDTQSLMTVHDSCYLGRYNGIYDAPRQALQAAGSLKETEENRENSMCCGAGGAQMWMEEMGDERVNIQRTGALCNTGASVIATGCPFCLTMISDGIKSLDKAGDVKAMDVAEVVANRLAK